MKDILDAVEGFLMTCCLYDGCKNQWLLTKNRNYTSSPTLEACAAKPTDVQIRSTVVRETTEARLVIGPLSLDLQGRWFDPWCGHDKISTAVGPLSKALNLTLLQGGMSPAYSNQL